MQAIIDDVNRKLPFIPASIKNAHDHELIKILQADPGNDHAMAQLFHNHFRILLMYYRQTWHYIGPDEKTLAIMDGFYESIRRFDPGRGKAFSTLYHTCITNRFLRIKRHQSQPIRYNGLTEYPLDKPWQNRNGEEYTLKDKIPYDDPKLEDVELSDLYRTIMERIEKFPIIEKRRQRVKNVHEVLTTTDLVTSVEVAKALGISQADTSRIIANIKREYMKELFPDHE